jgi:hypothetical protein
MGHRYGQFNVAHTFPADLGLGNLNTTSVTNDSTIADALIFTAMTFPVLDWPKNPFTEKAISFGLKRSIVDGFGLGYLSIGPTSNSLRRSQSYPYCVEIHRSGRSIHSRIYHGNPPSRILKP